MLVALSAVVNRCEDKNNHPDCALVRTTEALLCWDGLLIEISNAKEFALSSQH